ncbi:hypothetical protein MAR_038024 [Mya arenaria]|uniref:Uncharacterized protein n=1 Tax=Mya arenaria TaxID=6604 RepID=A0ABY7FQ49_MYAAR|nr:hypothetical protein MAR_038024 [Mya arenaria]
MSSSSKTTVQDERHNKFVGSGVGEEDLNVATERKRVTRGTARKSLLREENLTKRNCSGDRVVHDSDNSVHDSQTGSSPGADKMCFGLPEGELLTGDLRPTLGNAYLNRFRLAFMEFTVVDIKL